ncbi:MAG: hypothetical protein LIP28_01535, partial [Deltaproteobacteria bacterium]|nr:hypothetical protein [Deltaproteobacteria bacterium]
MTIPSDAWLERINDRMQREEIPIKSRPMKAIDYFQTEFNIKSTALNSPEAKKIISWFKENTNPRSLSIGSLYKGVFLYDTVFWEVRVPHFFGTVNLEIYKYIIDMPDVTKNKIINDDTHHDNYYI